MTSETALPRLTTGNPQLDEILGGGFPKNSINIIMGEPGSGKTILAERLIFANAVAGGRPILYLTTLSEPLEKLIRYLQQFSFYDEALLGSAIVYDTLGPDLAERGIEVVVPKLTEAIKSLRPQIIVIDSFKAIQDLAPSLPAMRRMLYEMSGLLTAYDTTAFLVGEYSESDTDRFPEFAVADGMISLARNKLSTRDERFLRVLKLRGSSYLEGLHGFHVTRRGLEVYLRLVSPQTPPSYELISERVPTGIAGLDAMLGSGVYRGTTTLVMGPTGSGKTTLGLQFVLEGLRRGEKGLYVNFEENPTQLARQIRSLGGEPDQARRAGLELLYRSPVELQIDSIIAEIFRIVSAGGRYRLVVDGVGDLLRAATDIDRLHNYLYALSQHLAVRGATTILTYEGTSLGLETLRISPNADSIFLLGTEVDGVTRRTIRVVKARGMEHDLATRELRITPHGIEVA